MKSQPTSYGRRPEALLLAEQYSFADTEPPKKESFSSEPDKHCWYYAEVAIANHEPAVFDVLPEIIDHGLEYVPQAAQREARLHFLQDSLGLLQVRANNRRPDTADWRQFQRASGARLARVLGGWHRLHESREDGRTGDMRGAIAEQVGVLLLPDMYPTSHRENRTHPNHTGYRIGEGVKMAAIESKIAVPVRERTGQPKPGVATLYVGTLAQHILQTNLDYAPLWGRLKGNPHQAPRVEQVDRVFMNRAFYALAGLVAQRAIGQQQLGELGQAFLQEAQRQAERLATEPGLTLQQLYPKLYR